MRGRGGRRRPARRQVASLRASRRPTATYVVVNAYQSDPAVLTDRVLLERNPYAVFEGAAIAAFTVGAQRGHRRGPGRGHRRHPDPRGRDRRRRRGGGYLGDNVLGSGARDPRLGRPLQGSYMLGEETVLLKGLEGKRGQPEQQPPYTTTRGLFGKPTLIHGPQTLRRGPDDRQRRHRRLRRDRRRGPSPARSSSRSPAPSPSPASPRSRSAPRSARSSTSPAASPLRAGSRPFSSAARRAASCPPTALDVTFDQDSLEKAGAHDRLGLDRGRRPAQPASWTWPPL